MNATATAETKAPFNDKQLAAMVVSLSAIHNYASELQGLLSDAGMEDASGYLVSVIAGAAYAASEIANADGNPRDCMAYAETLLAPSLANKKADLQNDERK